MYRFEDMSDEETSGGPYFKSSTKNGFSGYSLADNLVCCLLVLCMEFILKERAFVWLCYNYVIRVIFMSVGNKIKKLSFENNKTLYLAAKQIKRKKLDHYFVESVKTIVVIRCVWPTKYKHIVSLQPKIVIIILMKWNFCHQVGQYHMFMGNNYLYVFLRLHNLLCERLLWIKR